MDIRLPLYEIVDTSNLRLLTYYVIHNDIRLEGQ